MSVNFYSQLPKKVLKCILCWVGFNYYGMWSMLGVVCEILIQAKKGILVLHVVSAREKCF